MKSNHYRVTVQKLDPQTGEAEAGGELSFTALSHDDILAIAERSCGRHGLSADESAAMVVGLKLLGEIALGHRKEELFSDLCEHLGAFIQQLKRGAPKGEAHG